GAFFPGIPSQFASPAAMGALTAAVLALIALAAVVRRSRFARPLVALFNVESTIDLILAISLATIYGAAPHMGPAYWIPAFWVPALLVTHYRYSRQALERADVRAGDGGSRARHADASLAFAFLVTCKLLGTRTMPNPIGLIFAAAAILVSPVFVSAVLAATCPAPIAQASRLVLVTTQSMDTALATLQLFTRRSANMPWKRVS